MAREIEKNFQKIPVEVVSVSVHLYRIEEQNGYKEVETQGVSRINQSVEGVISRDLIDKLYQSIPAPIYGYRRHRTLVELRGIEASWLVQDQETF